MSDSDAVDQLAAKVAKVMGAIDEVPKTGKNDYHGYEYATDDDVMQKVRPAMSEHNLIALSSVKDRDVQRFGNDEDGYTLHTRVTLEITLIDADSGQSKTITWEGEAQDTQDKGLYKAYTSGIKYWALKTFLLSADTDVETDDIAGKRDSGSASGPQPPSSKQIEYARDLAGKDVWSEGEQESLERRINNSNKQEMSDLIDEMNEAIENRESSGNPQSNGSASESSELVEVVNNVVPNKYKSYAMQAGQAMPEDELDAYITILKTKEMPELADVIEEHHERYC